MTMSYDVGVRFNFDVETLAQLSHGGMDEDS